MPCLLDGCPVQPRCWFVEGNFSGDKKASYLGLITGRGRKVSASVTISEALVAPLPARHDRTGCSIMPVWRNLGATLSGQIGAQGHYANGLAAFYIATGQDAACVAESAVGFTRMERRADGLFMSVTLPNLLVGIGGRRDRPARRSERRSNLMGLAGAGKAAALAEVAASLCLAGRNIDHGGDRGGRFHARAPQPGADPQMNEAGISLPARLKIYQRERFPLGRTALAGPGIRRRQRQRLGASGRARAAGLADAMRRRSWSHCCSSSSCACWTKSRTARTIAVFVPNDRSLGAW